MLTPNLLDTFPYYQVTDYKTIQRGQQYFRDRRVFEIDYHDDHAFCQVQGQNDIYQVTISLSGKNKIQLGCTCPQAEVTNVCKHMVASLLRLNQYLSSEEMQANWQYKLGLALKNAPRRRASSNAHRYAAIFLLQKSEYYQNPTFSLIPRVVKASQWNELKFIYTDPATVNQSLDKDRGWTKHIESLYQTVNPNGCMNLPAEGIAFFNFAINNGGYYGFSNFADYLPMLAHLEIPIFSAGAHNSVKEKIRILSEPVEIRAALARNDDQFTLQAGIELDGQIFTSAKESLYIISQNPPWVLVGNNLIPVANPESLDILRNSRCTRRNLP
jgi:hypothetical protein